MKKRQRNVFQTIVLSLFLLTLITTALSMAKYAVTNSSEQIASVNSTKFIFSSNLVTSGTMQQEIIKGDTLYKDSYTLSDSYIPFQVKNYESADGITIINEEDIVYKISVSGNIKVVDISDPNNQIDATSSNKTMIQNIPEIVNYMIIPDGTIPGTYSGTISVTTIEPYVKKYVRPLNISLRGLSIEYNENGDQLFVSIQNGINDNVVLLRYSDKIIDVDVNASPSVMIENNNDVSPRNLVFSMPAGTLVTVQFRSPGTVLKPSDATYTIQ